MCRSNDHSMLSLDLLEDRLVLAGDIDFDDGVFTIEGSDYRDMVEVRFEGTRVYIDLYSFDSGGNLSHHDRDREISDVTRIVFYGSSGDDTVSVEDADLSPGVSLQQMQLEFYLGDDDDEFIGDTTSDLRLNAWGGPGQDALVGGAQADFLYGEGDSDRILGNGGDDWIVANEGRDEIYWNGGNDHLEGGEDDDTYFFRGRDGFIPGGNALIYDLDGDDMLYFADLELFGLAEGIRVDLSSQFTQAVFTGGFTLQLLSTIEDVIGTKFDDTLIGNSANNRLMGLDGRDQLTGGAGDDDMFGGPGNDTYKFSGANLGTDTIDEPANADADWLDFTGMSVGLSIDLAKYGADYAVFSSALKLKLSHSTSIENVYGTNYVDKIFGNSRGNKLYGRGGNDIIAGNGGNDRLYGGGGIDIMLGGAGSDRLYTDSSDQYVYGGAGYDSFDGYHESDGGSSPRTRYRDWGLV